MAAAGAFGRRTMKRLEITIYAVVILIMNMPVIAGGYAESMVLLPEKVLAGQWYRILAHPFVHLSWYHLLLDGAAFFILYTQLAERHSLKRTLYVAGAGLGSMLAVAAILGRMTVAGYCGLSGIGHGLMAICAFELIGDADKTSRRAGMISLGLLTAKCLFEAATGRMFLQFLHPDLLGTPIAISHIGGLLGAGIVYGLMNQTKFKHIVARLRLDKPDKNCLLHNA